MWSARRLLTLILPHALVIERGDELLGLRKLLRLADGRVRRRVDEQRRQSAGERDEAADLGRAGLGDLLSAKRPAKCRSRVSCLRQLQKLRLRRQLDEYEQGEIIDERGLGVES